MILHLQFIIFRYYGVGWRLLLLLLSSLCKLHDGVAVPETRP